MGTVWAHLDTNQGQSQRITASMSIRRSRAVFDPATWHREEGSNPSATATALRLNFQVGRISVAMSDRLPTVSAHILPTLFSEYGECNAAATASRSRYQQVGIDPASRSGPYGRAFSPALTR